jgi:hypothetical protein
MMNISSLKYYGERWLKWARKNKHTGNNSHIPERHQDQHKINTNKYSGNMHTVQIFYDEYRTRV